MRAAVVQRPPVLLDRDATIARAVEHLHEAADDGAQLVVFPEAYVPGYPVWIWHLRPGPDYGLTSELHAALLTNAVDLDADGLAPLRTAAAERSVTVVCGVHERDGSFGRSTLYNTLVTIGPDGAILNRHRKLVPTNPERMVWGAGDARGLRVVDTPAGRVGAPDLLGELHAAGARRAVRRRRRDLRGLHLGLRRHLAGDDAPHRRRGTLLGARVGLLAARSPTCPPTFPSRGEVFGGFADDAWLNPGDSVVVRPGGEVVAGPLHEEHGILYADLDVASVAAERRTLDVVGHYARNDVFRLEIDREPRDPIAPLTAE